MDVIVCVKHVPETAEADLKINPKGTAIEESGLVFDINEWDDYALEEAVQIKEKFEGSVTAITVGPEEADSTLRKCLARGANKAIRLTDPKFEGSDSFATAKILHNVIKDLPFNVILTGALASDDGFAAAGPILAELLGIPHATMVKKIELNGDFARVNRELEGGLEEVIDVKLPAVFSIQTGINEPRYVSIMGIRKAMQKETQVLGLAEVGLSENEVGESGSWIKTEKMYVPPVEKQAEFLAGAPEEIAAKIADILKSRGLV
ncbi:MAG: electron transfer flavoprotein subunit beta/FixA family protein [Candidatus Bathyarchaeota archaeon]|nr:MAG: electron transfer flavoprotein subunit beta/FixA family protein [Candidatus Bathyarchaeota archaeon]